MAIFILIIGTSATLQAQFDFRSIPNFSEKLKKPNSAVDALRIDITEFYHEVKSMAQDSLPGSYLFQAWGRDNFDNDNQTFKNSSGSKQTWITPDGKSDLWMLVFVTEELEEVILFFYEDGEIIFERFDLSEIPDDERPPDELLAGLQPIPENFISSTQALSIAMTNGLESDIVSGNNFSSAQIDYHLSAFWFEFEDVLTRDTPPFWSIELEFGQWNQVRFAYEYNIYIYIIDAESGTLIARLVEEGTDSPDPINVVSSSPANGDFGVHMTIDIQFEFSHEVEPGSVHLSDGHGYSSVLVYPPNHINIADNTPQIDDTGKVITYQVTHQTDGNYVWILHGVQSNNGGILSRPYVLNYTTSATRPTGSVSGRIGFTNLPPYLMKTSDETPGPADFVQDREKPVLPFGLDITDLDMSMIAAEGVSLDRVVVALLDEPFDRYELDHNLQGLSVRYATLSDPVTGHYTIPHVEDGTYYVVAWMFDVKYGMSQVFAYGFASEDMDEPTPVTVSGGNLSGIDFNVIGYIPELIVRSDAKDCYSIAIAFMQTVDPEARLIVIESFEERGHSESFMNTVSPDFAKGLTEFWGFYFYNDLNEEIHGVMTLNNDIYMHETFSIEDVMDDDEEIDFGSIKTISGSFVGSSMAMQAVLNDGLAEILRDIPEFGFVEIYYILGAIWFDNELVTDPETDAFWYIEVYGSWGREHGNQMVWYELDAEYAVDGITGALIGKTIETSLDNPTQIATEVTLSQNYPNPFNPTTTIRFELPVQQQVRLDIFDVTGRHVQTVHEGMMGAGSHAVHFNANQLSSGVYLYRLTSETQTLTRKMTLIK
jgi:hypothetical protein